MGVFINQNCPEEDPLDNRMSEDIIVELIYHYYSSTTLLHSRITSLRKYRHQKNETFDQFSARAERLIGAANFPSMTCDQIGILRRKFIGSLIGYSNYHMTKHYTKLDKSIINLKSQRPNHTREWGKAQSWRKESQNRWPS